MCKQARQDSFLGNAPVTDDSNLLDRLRWRLGQGSTGAYGQGKHKQEAAKARSYARDEAQSPRSAEDGSVLDLHRAEALRRAQVLVRCKYRLHGKNMHNLIAKKIWSCLKERMIIF